MKRYTFVNYFLLILIIASGITSCSPEKKLAIDFTNKANTKSILLLVPDYTYKVNLKTYILDSLDLSDDINKDSVLLSNSKYLSKLNDSLFIANYILGYAKSLSGFGFKMYHQNQLEDFLTIDSNSYQVNIAQIELEETLYTYRDEVDVFDSYYFHDHNLNAIYVNSWFEIDELDNESKHPIYFATDLITDMADGAFDYDIFSNRVRYMYNIDSLELNTLYDFAYRLGSEYAKYTFDVLLNQELDRKVEDGARSEKYWRYDPDQHTFYPATDDRFIPLDD
jgi:hypothetical protein